MLGMNVERDLLNMGRDVLKQVNKQYKQFDEWQDFDIGLTCTKKEYQDFASRSNSPRDKFFSQFDEIRTEDEYIIIYGKTWDLYINRAGKGSYAYDKKNHSKHYFKKQGGGTHYEKNFNNTRINVESAMYLAGCILTDCFPYTFEGFVINVVDTTGTHEQVNLSYDNLELTIPEANLAVSKQPGVLANKAFDFKEWIKRVNNKEQSGDNSVRIEMIGCDENEFFGYDF